MAGSRTRDYETRLIRCSREQKPNQALSVGVRLKMHRCALLLLLPVALVFAFLPTFFTRAKREAVPARRSDLIGYAVILGVVLAVAGIGYAVL